MRLRHQINNVFRTVSHCMTSNLLPLQIFIKIWEFRIRIGDGDWGELKIRDWDWRLWIRIKIGYWDWIFGLGLGNWIEDCDLGLGLVNGD